MFSTLSNTTVKTSKKAEILGPLGIYTKSQSNPSISDFQQSQIKRLEKFVLQEISSKLLPKERVRNCLRHRITKDSGVKVFFNPVRDKAHYGNLVRCGSVWNCPVCSAQISEKRKIELKKAIDNYRNKGGHVYLLTLTNRHNYGDNLSALLDGQKKALAYFWGDRKTKEKFKALGKFGHIIATEITYGDNGWHPHYHILLFMSKALDFSSFREFFGSAWLHCCKKSGLKSPTIEHGLDIRDGSYADNYVSKWGLEDELTKGHTKKGKEGGLTPFDLLRQSVENPEYEKLFQQFAISFKGKRQLMWSRGLKAALGIFEQSDEELAEETENTSVELRELAIEIWHLITKYSKRAEFLECIEHDYFNHTETANALVMRLAAFEVGELTSYQDIA